MHHALKVSFFIILLCLVSNEAVGQDQTKKDGRNFEKLNNAGLKALDAGDYSKALKYFAEAEILAETHDMAIQNMVVKMNFGKLYSDIHNLGEALKYYNEALDVVNENTVLEEYRVSLLVNIGVVYSDEGELLTGLDYTLKAYDIFKKRMNCKPCIVVAAINVSDCYNKLGNYKLARKYLDEVNGIEMDNANRQLWKINYAESYFKEGKIQEAEKIVTGVLENTDKSDENHCYLCIVKLLSEINEGKGNIQAAIAYARDGLKNSRSIRDTAQMYELLSDIYYNNEQYEKAYRYKDSLAVARDSISKSINSSLYTTNKVKLKIHDYQSEARHNMEKRESERTLFILIILLGIILFYFIYRSLKTRIIKQKQKNIIAANKETIYQLEVDKLTHDIAEKNRKLSAKALYLSGRNELIQEVISALDQIPEIQQASLHHHIKILKGHLKADEEWDDFILYFEQVNPHFLKLLQSKHPQLNAADVRFICYLYMNLDLKEIASILSITIEAARKRKQRIAKKMDCEIDRLNEYILKLN